MSPPQIITVIIITTTTTTTMIMIIIIIIKLKKIDTKTRKLLNMHKMLHPKADVERLYIPRKDGGRGLIDVETAFKTATIAVSYTHLTLPTIYSV